MVLDVLFEKAFYTNEDTTEIQFMLCNCLRCFGG